MGNLCVFAVTHITTLPLYIQTQVSKLNAFSIFFSLQQYNNREELHFSSKETAVCSQPDHVIPFVTSLKLSSHPNKHIPGVAISFIPPPNTASRTADYLLQNYQQLL